jgi:hypothetical protein
MVSSLAPFGRRLSLTVAIPSALQAKQTWRNTFVDKKFRVARTADQCALLFAYVTDKD